MMRTQQNPSRPLAFTHKDSLSINRLALSGICGWLAENLPELSAHYKTLMRYKAMAIRLRQATGTKDPKPTSALLDETPRHKVVDEILEDFRMTFSSLEETLAWHLDAELVFLKEKRSDLRKRARPKRE